MRRVSRALVGLALVALTVSIPAEQATAGIPNVCSWNANSRTATIDLVPLGNVEGTTVGRLPGTKKLGYNAEGVGWRACPQATTTSADKLVVDGGDLSNYVALTIANGPLAPGFSAEGKGQSEIEVHIDLGSGTDHLFLIGGGDKDALILKKPTAALVNADGDTDVSIASVWDVGIEGGAGNDFLDGRGGRADLRGGDGDDTLFAGPDDNLLCGDCGPGAGGADIIFGGGGNDDIDGGPKADVLAGDDGQDDLDGGPGNDSMEGGAGPDVFLTGTSDDGSDQFKGGLGTDTISYGDRGSGVRIAQNSASDDGERGEGDRIAGDIEVLGGTVNADLIVGSDLDQDISALDGDDVVKAMGGEDIVQASTGDDTVSGGAGDDVLPDEAGNDSYSGGDGEDALTSEISGLYDDAYAGGRGLDTIDFSARSLSMSIDVNTPDGDGVAGESDDVHGDVEVILGGSGADVIQGGLVANEIYGDGWSGVGAGDIILGGGGPDLLYGGDGGDSIDGQEGFDQLFGQAGNDSMYAADGAADLVNCGASNPDGALVEGDIGLDSVTNCTTPF